MDIDARWGVVRQITAERPGGVTEILVEVAGSARRAVNFTAFTGEVEPGQRVLLNTTAVELGLGSGGFDFVMAVDRAEERAASGSPGHIMKLRYTPLQFKVLGVEEEASPLRTALEGDLRLGGMPVLVGTLHSHLAPALIGLHVMAKRPVRVAYIMTDGAALPLAWSKSVADFRRRGWLTTTITAGQAFGGDLEAVNKYSALLAAKAAGADVAVVTMGPGIVGTGTKYGHTGLEQGELVDAVNTLGGRAVAIPRLSFADARPRHRGLSHHFLTALGEICHSRADIVLPELGDEERTFVMRQVADSPGMARHRFLERPGRFVGEAAIERDVDLMSMGRSFVDDPSFFAAGAAAGAFVAELLASDQVASGALHAET